MTGVAAQMCGSDDPVLRGTFEAKEKNIQWGKRKAILNDLSPAATLIAYNYNYSVNDMSGFKSRCNHIFDSCRKKYGWMYETIPTVSPLGQVNLFSSEQTTATINYTNSTV